MDKVFSTRLDEAVIDELNRLSRNLGIPKKRLLEEAILKRAKEEQQLPENDVWSETCGAWKRRESPQTTVRKTREAFESSMRRHHEE